MNALLWSKRPVISGALKATLNGSTYEVFWCADGWVTWRVQTPTKIHFGTTVSEERAQAICEQFVVNSGDNPVVSRKVANCGA